MPLLFTGHKRRMDLQCLGVWEHAPHNLVGMASSAELKLCSTTTKHYLA